MGSVISMTTTAGPFCYNWFRILKLVALTLPVSAPDLRNSRVASSMRGERVFLPIKHSPVDVEFVVNARGRACFEGGVVVTSGMHIWAL